MTMGFRYIMKGHAHGLSGRLIDISKYDMADILVMPASVGSEYFGFEEDKRPFPRIRNTTMNHKDYCYQISSEPVKRREFNIMMDQITHIFILVKKIEAVCDHVEMLENQVHNISATVQRQQEQ